MMISRDKKYKEMDAKRIAWFVLEAVILIAIFVLWRTKTLLIPKTKLGFICGDSSLSLPYKNATIPTDWLNLPLYAFPLLIWLIELSFRLIPSQREMKKKFIAATLQSLKWFLYYYVVFMIQSIIMELIKNLAGAHRPIFLEICQPDLAKNCTRGEYISSDYKCTNTEAGAFILSEVTKSFPSGHTMSAVYTTVFFMRYLQARFWKCPVLLAGFHLTCLCWIVICSVSRLFDHYHHNRDVVGGIITALLFAFYSCEVLCKGFRITPKEKESTNQI